MDGRTSGTSHMCHDFSLLHNPYKLKKIITLLDGSTKPVLYSGDVILIHALHLKLVFYALSFKHILLSLCPAGPNDRQSASY